MFADPWSTQDFRDCVAYALFLVAEAEDKVLGYAVALEAADEGEILNLAVAEDGAEWDTPEYLLQQVPKPGRSSRRPARSCRAPSR